ncbi:MAG TPA: hypothetical protein VFR24_01900 [Candidatus Angelobacter sp.]|nr:hypothetical protein [Candidatus Angelobacter sp.]
MTKQQIIDAVMEWTEKLGHVPSHVELLKYAGVSRKTVRRHFANYRAVLAECNLAGTGSGYKAELAEVFRDWAQVARALGKLPSIAEYTLRGQFSVRPLVQRFGTWSNAPYGLKLYAEEQGWTGEWKDVLALVEAREKQERAMKELKQEPGPENIRRARRFAAKNGLDPAQMGLERVSILKEGREIFGRLMRPGPMICAPTNEQGVLFLFGARAEELGFAVLRIRAEYPDCLAFRQVGEDCMELVRIEFEFESKNFLKHMHEPNKCDLIVCWRHNWKECPMEVIELGNRRDRT